jgi:hypothetical protein
LGKEPEGDILVLENGWKPVSNVVSFAVLVNKWRSCT